MNRYKERVLYYAHCLWHIDDIYVTYCAVQSCTKLHIILVLFQDTAGVGSGGGGGEEVSLGRVVVCVGATETDLLHSSLTPYPLS